jgi:hypothetical protein
MDTAGNCRRASERLLEHCFALLWEPGAPTAKDRLDEVLGRELARTLVAALTPAR